MNLKDGYLMIISSNFSSTDDLSTLDCYVDQTMQPEISPSKLVTLFKGIEKPISMNGFSDKLKIQKIAYLTQTYGVDLDYPFEWYIRSPYCRQVSEHVHEIINAKIRPTDSAGLDESKITRFGELLRPYINDTDWLEIAGSLVYLRNENYTEMPLEDIVGHLIEDLIWGYKNFDECLVRSVITEMSRMKLIK